MQPSGSIIKADQVPFKRVLLLEISQWKSASPLHASPQPSLGIQLSNIIGTLSQMHTSNTETQFEDEPPQILLANFNL